MKVVWYILWQYLFSESTKVEIEKSKVHARKGCLSDINIGGTNRNEAFHRYVNTFFHKSRQTRNLIVIRPDDDYYTSYTSVHQYNSKFRNSRKCIFVPVQKSQSDNRESDEPMRIAQSTDSECFRSLLPMASGIFRWYNIYILYCRIHFKCPYLSWMYTKLKIQTKTASPLLKYIPFAQMLPCNYQGSGASQDENSVTFVEVHTIYTNAAMHS